jgi:hypothetical protein
MSEIQMALADGQQEVDALKAAAASCAESWTKAGTPGKWSPSQLVEHVALSLEASALDMRGERSTLPQLPGIVRPLARVFLFNRVLQREAFPKAKTNKAMNPAQGPGSVAEGQARLDAAWKTFSDAALAAGLGSFEAESRVFGRVHLRDYVRFQLLHARHHRLQLPGQK